MVKEPDHRFLLYLFEKTGRFPDDPFFEDMDPLMKLYLYESWINKLELEFERERNLGILIGSFTNPEAAQKMVKKDHPDVVATEDEAEENKALKELILKEEKVKKKRKRRVVKNG